MRSFLLPLLLLTTPSLGQISKPIGASSAAVKQHQEQQNMPQAVPSTGGSYGERNRLKVLFCTS